MMPIDDETTPTVTAAEAAVSEEKAPDNPSLATEPAVGADAPHFASQSSDADVASPTPEASTGEPPSAEPTPTSKEGEPTVPAPEATTDLVAGTPDTPTSDAMLFEQAVQALDTDEPVEGLDAGFKKLSKGDKVEATVIQVDSDRVFVDLGTKSEGIVPIAELTDEPIAHASQHVKVGDRIQVVVIRPEGGEGNPIVSKKRADFEGVWRNIEAAHARDEMVHATVVDRVKGGLVVDLGVRGFIPATHVGNGRLRNIDRYVGQTIECKILEIDRERKKVVLSNRLALEEKRKSAKEEIFNKVKPGDVLKGTVRRLTDYGAFVDLGGVDGLLHISEMSWMRISHPREMFKEGQEIQVMVLRLEKESGKISLGHRQVLPDPWNLIRENYRPNQKLTVTISRCVQNGAFVKLPEGAEAFLPLSEMSSRRLKRPQEAVEEGQEVEVQIIDLKPDDRRMVLSMRALGAGAAPGPMSSTTSFGDEDREQKRGARRKKKGRSRQDEDEIEDYISRRGFGSAGVTIGERLGMLKGFAGREGAEDLDIEEPGDEGDAKEPETKGAGSEEVDE